MPVPHAMRWRHRTTGCASAHAPNLLKLQRHQFGRKSERLPEEQLELGLADLETAIAKADADAEKRDPWPAAGSMDTEFSLNWPSARTP